MPSVERSLLIGCHVDHDQKVLRRAERKINHGRRVHRVVPGMNGLRLRMGTMRQHREVQNVFSS